MRESILASSLAVLLAGVPLAALAQTQPAQTVPGQTAPAGTGLYQGQTDAGDLIGEDVVDAQGNEIGEIDSVMVDPNGKVTSVIIDVGDWLQGEKLIAVRWQDLKRTGDNRIMSQLTRSTATAAQSYAYADPSWRRKVLNQPADNMAGTGGNAALASQLHARDMIGMDVRNRQNEHIGDINDLVLDANGRVQGVIVDVGGFLGVGARPVMLNWQEISLAGQGNDRHAMIDLSSERLKQMPAYQAD